MTKTQKVRFFTLGKIDVSRREFNENQKSIRAVKKLVAVENAYYQALSNFMKTQNPKRLRTIVWVAASGLRHFEEEIARNRKTLEGINAAVRKKAKARPRRQASAQNARQNLR